MHNKEIWQTFKSVTNIFTKSKTYWNLGHVFEFTKYSKKILITLYCKMAHKLMESS